MVGGLRPADGLEKFLGFRPHSAKGSKARALHPEAMWDEDDEPASRPPASRGRKLKRPVTFLCPSVPALGLGMHRFEHGRLTLEYAEDVRAIRRHSWIGSRIFKETPAIRKQLAAQQALEQELSQKQRELAEDAQAIRAKMGPRGPLVPIDELAGFPVRQRSTGRW
jgi:hypothetical protein